MNKTGSLNLSHPDIKLRKPIAAILRVIMAAKVFLCSFERAGFRNINVRQRMSQPFHNNVVHS